MGKGSKYNSSKARINPIFKVAGSNLKNNKGKPKEVVSKLKNFQLKDKTQKLDDKLKELQHAALVSDVKIAGKVKEPTVIPPSKTPKPATVTDAEMGDLADLLGSKS